MTRVFDVKNLRIRDGSPGKEERFDPPPSAEQDVAPIASIGTVVEIRTSGTAGTTRPSHTAYQVISFPGER